MPRWGQANREIIPLEDLILKRLAAGETVRQVWRDLHAEGRITVAKSQFHAAVSKLKARRNASPLSRLPRAVATPLPHRSLSTSVVAAGPVGPADDVHMRRFEHDATVSSDFRLTPADASTTQGSTINEGQPGPTGQGRRR